MAEKKTTAKKKTTKKAKDNKIIKEVAENIIKKEEFEEVTKEAVEQDPPLTNLDAEIEGVDEANLNAMRNEWEVKNEHEYTPTVEQVEKAIETMNGDPSVIIPSNEIEIKKDLTTEIEKKAFRDTFRELNNNKKLKLDNSFGYSWNGMEMD
jgi:hypothetical protein